MSEGFEQQIGTYEHRLDHLVRDGLDLRRNLSTAGRDLDKDLEAMRIWQRECAATISQLSGGSKQHWLSRAYSDAFLVRAAASSGSLHVVDPVEAVDPVDAGEAVNIVNVVVREIPVDAIVDRIMAVLREAQASLAGMRESGAPPAVRPAAPRFSFVHEPHLAPELEQAFSDGQAAFERGAHGLALVTWASILEAILTDALAHARPKGEGADRDRPLAEWTFAARIAAAEQARLISAGCARLPDAARRYRELLDSAGDLRSDAPITEQDAKRTNQVLRLIMRDLTPGR